MKPLTERYHRSSRREEAVTNPFRELFPPRLPKLGGYDGAVLMEVILALALFVAAAAVVTGGFNRSVDELERLRLRTRALNLAATVLAEFQLGARELEMTGAAQDFEAPFVDWTWEAATDPSVGAFTEADTLLVEVIVRHKTEPVIHRLAQFIRRPVSGGTLEEDEL